MVQTFVDNGARLILDGRRIEVRLKFLSLLVPLYVILNSYMIGVGT